jgi:hypothetical protein
MSEVGIGQGFAESYPAGMIENWDATLLVDIHNPPPKLHAPTRWLPRRRLSLSTRERKACLAGPHLRHSLPTAI